MSKPVLFYGKPGQLQPCLTHVTVQILAQGITDDDQKCATLAQCFRGPALSWLTNELEAKPSLLHDWEKFKVLLEGSFGLTDSAKTHQAAKQLRTLQQRGSAQLYTVNFDQLSTSLVLDDDTAKAYYLEGLKLHVREAIVSAGAHKLPLATIKTRAIDIDTELYNARKSGAGRGQGQRQRGSTDRIKCHKCGKFGHKQKDCRSGDGY